MPLAFVATLPLSGHSQKTNHGEIGGKTLLGSLVEGVYLADLNMTEGSVRSGNRSLFYCQVGDPNGLLVIHNHGGPSSRLEARIFAPRSCSAE
jgi:hypothetical protein